MILNSNSIIRLRPIELEDIDLIQSWRNNPEIQPFVREYRELNKSNIEEWYKSIVNNNKFIFFIIEDLKNSPVGVAGLTYIDWINKHADLHLGIYEKPWADPEYGEETLKIMLNHGFNYLNLNKIYAEIYSIDTTKLGLFEKNRFKKDAVLREHYYFNGKYEDSIIVSILKSEFKQQY